MESETLPPPAKKLRTEPIPSTVAKTAEKDGPSESAESIPISKPTEKKDVELETTKIDIGQNDKTKTTKGPTANKADGQTVVKHGTVAKQNPQVPPNTKQNGYEARDRVLTSIDHVDLSRVIEGIQECDFEIEEMTISANQKVMEIEKSLRESKKPVYCNRSELIQHIPEFWLTTLINHHHISHFINEADEDCLQYLKKMHVEEFDDSVSGFKISFLFEPNPYFENAVICKEISFGHSGMLRSKATPIRWKPGHDLTWVNEASASSSKSQPQSFFHWFLQNANPVQDKIAVFIRDDIWPNPLKYFQVHTEESIIDISSDGIIVDSSGEEEDEDEDESVLVLDKDDEEYGLEDEDIELLENEGELLDEDFDESEDDLLLDEDEDDEDFDDDDEELELLESGGPNKQRTVVKQTTPIEQSTAKPDSNPTKGKSEDKEISNKQTAEPADSQNKEPSNKETESPKATSENCENKTKQPEETAQSEEAADKKDDTTAGEDKITDNKEEPETERVEPFSSSGAT